MKVFRSIKEPFIRIRNNYKARHKQKLLVKTNDDKLVVKSLPAEKDNSAIDIRTIVKNMDDPEEMAKVVENNLEEIIEQDEVKNTLRYLDDSDVLRILNENNKKLQSNEKIIFAIEAIGGNEKKIKAVIKNLEFLNDCELAKILETLKPETERRRKIEMEEQKIKIVSKRILRHMINNGGAWHLKELTETLEEKSKLLIAQRCLETIGDYEKGHDVKKHITSAAKIKLVVDLFQLTSLPYEKKKETLDEMLNNGLTQQEIKLIEGKMAEERIKKEQAERERKIRIRKDKLGIIAAEGR